ncbi:HTH domain-containing protein [Clostridium estertheticum]|nr:HTH domain-containing protein [Clostridium estertheticum]
MGKTYFTEEQQSELRKNAYVQKISMKSITYTKKFKERFEEK